MEAFLESRARFGKKDFYISVQMAQETDVDKFEDVGKTVAEHMADNKDVLAHCKEGKHHSGCSVCFMGGFM